MSGPKRKPKSASIIWPFCGEQPTGADQGYMEGRALSGARAPVEVAEALGLSARAESALIAAPATPPSPQIRILRRAIHQTRRERRLRERNLRGLRARGG